MNVIVRTLNRSFGARMAKGGRFLLIETTGRTTGKRHATPVGYEHAGDGTIFVGAGSPTAHWAHNLLADPVCRAEHGTGSHTYRAEPLEGEPREVALRAIKGRYGPGMADRIGQGPVFRLIPAEN